VKASLLIIVMLTAMSASAIIKATTSERNRIAAMLELARQHKENRNTLILDRKIEEKKMGWGRSE